MRYAEALAKRGDSVDVIAIKVNPAHPDTEIMGSVHVHRLLLRSRKLQQGKLSYLLPILKFWLSSSLWLAKSHTHRRYDFIHVHNVPDFLVFAAWWPRMFGAKIILDIHDIVPEFYASKFKRSADSFVVKALKKVERASARLCGSCNNLRKPTCGATSTQPGLEQTASALFSSTTWIPAYSGRVRARGMTES